MPAPAIAIDEEITVTYQRVPGEVLDGAVLAFTHRHTPSGEVLTLLVDEDDVSARYAAAAPAVARQVAAYLRRRRRTGRAALIGTGLFLAPGHEAAATALRLILPF